MIRSLSLKNRIHHSLIFFNDSFSIATNGLCTTPQKRVCKLDSCNNLFRTCSEVTVKQLYIHQSLSKHLSLKQLKTCPLRTLNPVNILHDNTLVKFYSTGTNPNEKSSAPSKREKLKRAVKDYGATVIVFHVTLSLLSLGACYLAVTSGLKAAMIPALEIPGEVAAETSMFVIAYALHKVLAPVRVAITLFASPFIVQYLRKINVLKTPPKI